MGQAKWLMWRSCYRKQNKWRKLNTWEFCVCLRNDTYMNDDQLWENCFEYESNHRHAEMSQEMLV